MLELHGPGGFTTVVNNNWQDDPAQAVLIQATGLAPTNNLEAAIDATLPPGAYTGVVRGNGGTTGVALVEVYDLIRPFCEAGNISTRVLSERGTTRDCGLHSGNKAVPPELCSAASAGADVFGVPNALANPPGLRDSNAALLASNDDCRATRLKRRN